MNVIDLTKRLNRDTEIYRDETYQDPPFGFSDWCSIESQGYRVSAITLGTQTGTHIDAPAHFDPQGVTLEALPVDRLAGRYLLIDLLAEMDDLDVKTICERHTSEPILLIRTPQQDLSFHRKL